MFYEATEVNYLHVGSIIITMHEVDISAFGSVLIGNLHNASESFPGLLPEVTLLQLVQRVNGLPKTVKKNLLTDIESSTTTTVLISLVMDQQDENGQ